MKKSMTKALSLLLTAMLPFGLMTGCKEQAKKPPPNSGNKQTVALNANEDYGTIPANLSIGTNPSGQTAYVQGAGIADVINHANIGTTVTVEETNGLPVNVQLLETGDIEFGYVNNVMLKQAYMATDSYADFEPGKIMGVMSISPTEMHVFLPANSNIKSVNDLAGKRVGIGQPGGIAREMALIFLEALGYKDGDIKYVEVNLGTECDYMQDGQLDAALWIGSSPLPPLSSLFATNDVKLLDIDDEAFEKLYKVLPEAKRAIIPANTYENQTKDVNTFGVFLTIAARSDLSNETVYQFTKLVMENVDKLALVHPSLGDISPKTVTLGMTQNTPLHPGALRYYEELGVEGLDKLRAD